MGQNLWFCSIRINTIISGTKFVAEIKVTCKSAPRANIDTTEQSCLNCNYFIWYLFIYFLPQKDERLSHCWSDITDDFTEI